jgi:hypothetical protein
MQTHHANSPGRGVAVMASREVLRIRRRCWARIQRLPILGDHGHGHGSRCRSRSPRRRVVDFGGVLGDLRARSDQISSLAGHFSSPGHSSVFFFQNSFHISSTRRKQSKQGSATASSSNSAPSLRIGLLLLESSHLPK